MEIKIPNPERKRALILVDIQDGFLKEDHRWIIPNIKKVISEGTYDLTIEAVFHADPGSLWDKQVEWLFPLEETTQEIKELLDPKTVYIRKATKSVFKGDKDLHKILKDNDIEEVHIVGLDTNDCVFATAQESFDLGFFTYVLEECTAASSGVEYREKAIYILRGLEMTNHSLLIVILALSLRVVKEYDRGVVFFLGKVTGVRGPGLIILIPVLEQMTKVTLRTITMNIPSQKIITKDNVSIDIAAVAYYHIVDPQRSVVAIENVYDAVNQISQTTVRNVVGQFMLDQLLSQTSTINMQIKEVIDTHTEPWGAQVTAVEIKDITLPDNMQRAMAKEAEAERERRAKIVAAEGEFQAAVKLGEAADIIAEHPVALQLRTLQTMAEISVEKNSTIIFPAQFMTTIQEAMKFMSADSKK